MTSIELAMLGKRKGVMALQPYWGRVSTAYGILQATACNIHGVKIVGEWPTWAKHYADHPECWDELIYALQQDAL